MFPGTRLISGGIPGTAALSVRLHSLLQQKKIGASRFYSKEETVAWETSLNDYRVIVEGRMDLVYRRGKKTRVEEIKGVVLPRESFERLDIDSYPEFIKQTQIYAFLLSQRDPDKRYQTIVLMVNLHTNKIKRFEVPFDRETLRRDMDRVLGHLTTLPDLRERELEKKREWAGKLVFPLREKRPGQELMMSKVTEALNGRFDLTGFRSHRDRQNRGSALPRRFFRAGTGQKDFLPDQQKHATERGGTNHSAAA